MAIGNWTQWATAPVAPVTRALESGKIQVRLPATREEERRRELLQLGSAVASEWAALADNGSDISLTTFLRRAAEGNNSELTDLLAEMYEHLARPDASEYRQGSRSDRLVGKILRLLFRSRSLLPQVEACVPNSSSPRFHLVPSLSGAPCAPPLVLASVRPEGQRAA